MTVDDIIECLCKALTQVVLEKTESQEWPEKLVELKQDANTFKELKKRIPEGWVPSRIAASALLTQQANVNRIIFPNGVDEWVSMWENELMPPKNRNGETFRNIMEQWFRGRNNYHFAKQYADYYVRYWEKRNYDLERSREDLEYLESIGDKRTLKKFWQSMDGIGAEYSKNLPMDEIHELVIDSVKIDSRLSSILKKTIADNLKPKEKEIVFLEAGKCAGLNGWETDRICFWYRDRVKELFLNYLNEKRS